MKVLNLLRHAKSSWSAESLSDKDRPLNNRGTKACKIMGPRMLERDCGFSYILCSPAQRAQETIEGISSALNAEWRWHTEPELYTFDSRVLLQIVANLDDEQDEVLLVGHNPAFTDLSNQLSEARIDYVPTCTWVSIEFECDSWAEVVEQQGRLRQFVRPKDDS